MPLAAVAAMGMELAPLRSLSSDGLLLVETGIGVENVERTLHAQLKGKAPAAILGIGLAGALSSALQVGDLVIGREVFGPSRLVPSPRLLSLAREVKIADAAIYAGTVVTINEMACSADSKQLLASAMTNQPVACVDMESWAIARSCSHLQIPFLAVRSISDRFDEDLPLDFNCYRRADGNLDFFKIICAALVRPRSVGGLWRLRGHAKLCTRRLVQFVERMLLAIRDAQC
jgi:adenosylhomocysteine nucleosidase